MAIDAEGIDSRRYFFPPIHRQKAYARLPQSRELPVTDKLAERLLTPPLFSHMTHEQVRRVAEAVARIQTHAPAVRAALAGRMSDWTSAHTARSATGSSSRATTPTQVRLRLEHALAPLADPTAAPSGSYKVTDHGADGEKRYTLDFDSSSVFATDSQDHLAGLVAWHVNGSVVRAGPRAHLLLHASAAECDGVTVVLPAPMESGKTTTVAGLLRAGYRYVTDETVVLGPRRPVDHGVPEGARPGRVRGAAAGRGATAGLPARGHSDAQQQVPWRDLGSPGVATGGRPELIVFPSTSRGATTVAEPVTPGAAVLELAASTFRFRERPRRNLDAWPAWPPGPRPTGCPSVTSTRRCR